MTNFLYKINPFIKVVLMVTISIILTFIHSYIINMWIFGICIFIFLIGTKPVTWLLGLKIMIPIGFIGFSIFMSGVLFSSSEIDQFGGLGLENTQSGLNMLSRFLSFAALGILVSLTTDAYELMKSMQTFGRVPRKFAYGILAALNIVPHMKNEYQNAKLAFAVRGVRVHPFSLKILFTMLVNCVRWSEMLAIAMISKGFHK